VIAELYAMPYCQPTVRQADDFNLVACKIRARFPKDPRIAIYNQMEFPLAPGLTPLKKPRRLQRYEHRT
jgi:hypothetical protein